MNEVEGKDNILEECPLVELMGKLHLKDGDRMTDEVEEELEGMQHAAEADLGSDDEDKVLVVDCLALPTSAQLARIFPLLLPPLYTTHPLTTHNLPTFKSLSGIDYCCKLLASMSAAHLSINIAGFFALIHNSRRHLPPARDNQNQPWINEAVQAAV